MSTATPSKMISRADIEATFRRSGPMVPPNQQHQQHPGNLHHQQQIQHAQQLAHQEAQMKKREEAKNRSQKPVDRNLPDGIEDLVVGDGAKNYKHLREMERKLDSLMMRKRLDIQDSAHRDAKKYGTMRIWISNTVENQPWQYHGMNPDAFDFTRGVEPTFRVKIEGKLLEDEYDKLDGEEGEQGEEGNENVAEKTGENGTTNDADGGGEDDEPAAKRPKLSPSKSTTSSQKKFSRYFKSITIDFDRSRSLQPDNYTRIEWKRPDFLPSNTNDLPKEADFDCLEFERKSDENINITINLVRDEQPERYKLAKPLAELLDMEEADRQTVLMGIWEYIRLAGLQTDEDWKYVRCDSRLREIFNSDTIFFPSLRDTIKPLLSDPPPLTLNYTIRVDKPFHTTSPSPSQNSNETPTEKYTIYDIPIPYTPPTSHLLTSITRSSQHLQALRQIVSIDDELALLVAKMVNSKAKHEFLTSLSRDPVGFLKRWMRSQRRDLDVLLGTGGWGGEEGWRDLVDGDGSGASGGGGGGNGAVWESREVEEGVGSWLSRIKG